MACRSVGADHRYSRLQYNAPHVIGMFIDCLFVCDDCVVSIPFFVELAFNAPHNPLAALVEGMIVVTLAFNTIQYSFR